MPDRQPGPIEGDIVANKWKRLADHDTCSDAQILARHLDKLIARLSATFDGLEKDLDKIRKENADDLEALDVRLATVERALRRLTAVD